MLHIRRPQYHTTLRNINQGSVVLLDIGYNSRQQTETEPISMVGLVLWNLLYMCYFLLPPCHYLYSTAVQSSLAKFIAMKKATFMQNLQCQCNNFSYKRLDFHQKIGMIIIWIQSFRWQGIFGKPELPLKFVHNKKSFKKTTFRNVWTVETEMWSIF
jgi:hypothetical protein